MMQLKFVFKLILHSGLSIHIIGVLISRINRLCSLFRFDIHVLCLGGFFLLFRWCIVGCLLFHNDKICSPNYFTKMMPECSSNDYFGLSQLLRIINFS
jgi:hypothetical protein